MSSYLNSSARTQIEMNEGAIRKAESEIRTAKRKLVSDSGGSCLTCKHTKVALGQKLLCKKKDKLVSQYNYCELHQFKS